MAAACRFKRHIAPEVILHLGLLPPPGSGARILFNVDPRVDHVHQVSQGHLTVNIGGESLGEKQIMHQIVWHGIQFQS